MYYIINETNHIIAADDALLELLSVSTIGELHQNIALHSISLEKTDEDTLSINTLENSTLYNMTSHTLTSVLGDMTLITINNPATKNSEADILTEAPDEHDFSLIDDDGPITFNDGPAATEQPESTKEETSVGILEEEVLFDLISDDKPFLIDEPESEAEAPIEETPETETDESIPEETEEEETSPITINISEISQKIGISEEDYTTFLNEYIDTALTLEEDLKSTQAKKRSHAVTTLLHLSNVLHLPVLNQIMTDIEGSEEEEQNRLVRSFYTTLARLTTSRETDSEAAEVPEKPESEKGSESFGTIDLSDVKPIHFDFQLEEAADDLSLPTELIEEFVMDFIDQAHMETDKMLKAYEQGDLQTIQKIGHLLKGTSSNLRINPLADTLYKIQFCEDSSQLEDLIKEYWAHFLSFEHQISIISK